MSSARMFGFDVTERSFAFTARLTTFTGRVLAFTWLEADSDSGFDAVDFELGFDVNASAVSEFESDWDSGFGVQSVSDGDGLTGRSMTFTARSLAFTARVRAFTGRSMAFTALTGSV